MIACMEQNGTGIRRGTVVVGLAELKPLKGFPKGKIRIRMRSDDLLKVYIWNKTGIRVYSVNELDGVWYPGLLIAANMRGEEL